MKKLLCFTLTALLAAALAAPAFADDTAATNKTLDSNKLSDTTKVEFSVQPTYTVTIPATVELGKVTAQDGTVTYEKDLTLTASNVRLNENEKLKVSLQSDYNLSVNSTVLTYQLPYTVTAKTTNPDTSKDVTAADPQVATFVTNPDDQTVTLHFAAENPKFAGDYTDTVTFTLKVEGAAQTGNGGNT